MNGGRRLAPLARHHSSVGTDDTHSNCSCCDAVSTDMHTLRILYRAMNVTQSRNDAGPIMDATTASLIGSRVVGVRR